VGRGRNTSSAGLRALPSVHELAAELEGPHPLRVRAARQAIEEQRAALVDGAPQVADLASRARQVLAELDSLSLRRVVNATGVIVHTNLGRAPLPEAAKTALDDAATGYSNLELDLDLGRRGSRQTHVQALLCELTGAEAALAVNNGAAAVLLAAAALAGPGRAIVVSRGQLVEIGGGFRIPEVVAQSGSTLVEVGTTNRTRVKDYKRALKASETPVGAVLRVHQSNFRTVGFVEEVEIEALCALGIPVIDDIGSGALAEPMTEGRNVLGDEPSIRRSIAAGAALACCSGDKLLGGPQAGIIVGQREAVEMAAAHPLARAVRIDKLSLAVLEATLMLYRDPQRAWREVPVLAMLTADEEVLSARAARLKAGIGPAAEIIRTSAAVGGGALPLFELEGPAVAVDSDNAAALVDALRTGHPPVIARIHDGRVVLDPRTLAEDEVEPTSSAVRAALAR
jgi:L-seryl-tRNA(Ser) seleniumtransferase